MKLIVVESRERFAVIVEDAAGDVVAAGVHGLHVIDVAGFRDRLAAKGSRLRRTGAARGAHGGRLQSARRSRLASTDARSKPATHKLRERTLDAQRTRHG
jgi:hypothetical protein